MRKWIIIGLCLAAYIVLGIAGNVPAGEIVGDGALSLFLILIGLLLYKGISGRDPKYRKDRL